MLRKVFVCCAAVVKLGVLCADKSGATDMKWRFARML